jgi:protein subunit release factor A
MTPEHKEINDPDWSYIPCDEAVADERSGSQITVPTGCLVTHLESGLSAFSGRERSQMRNRDVAKRMIQRELLETACDCHMRSQHHEPQCPKQGWVT